MIMPLSHSGSWQIDGGHRATHAPPSRALQPGLKLKIASLKKERKFDHCAEVWCRFETTLQGIVAAEMHAEYIALFHACVRTRARQLRLSLFENTKTSYRSHLSSSATFQSLDTYKYKLFSTKTQQTLKQLLGFNIFFVILFQQQHGESVRRPLPLSSPRAAREKGQVDDAICGLGPGHKTAPLCAQKPSIITGPHTNANDQRVPERCACCAVCTAGPCGPRGHQLSRKSPLGFYLFTLGSSWATRTELCRNTCEVLFIYVLHFWLLFGSWIHQMSPAAILN